MSLHHDVLTREPSLNSLRIAVNASLQVASDSEGSTDGESIQEPTACSSSEYRTHKDSYAKVCQPTESQSAPLFLSIFFCRILLESIFQSRVSTILRGRWRISRKASNSTAISWGLWSSPGLHLKLRATGCGAMAWLSTL